MFTKRRDWIVLIALHALLLLTVYVLQGMIFPYMRIVGFIPLLLPIVSVGIAVNEGCHAGGIAGLFAGILCDSSFNQPVGVFTVLLTLTGLFVGALVDSVVMRGFVTYMVCCFVVLIISALVQIFPYFVFDRILERAFLSVALRQTLFSIVFAPLLWFFARALGRQMQNIISRERPL